MERNSVLTTQLDEDIRLLVEEGIIDEYGKLNLKDYSQQRAKIPLPFISEVSSGSSVDHLFLGMIGVMK